MAHLLARTGRVEEAKQQLAAIAWMSGQYEPAGAALDQCIKLSQGDRASPAL